MVGFLVVFYGLLVGGKFALAWLVARGSPHLRGPWHVRVQWIAGLLLACLGVLLIWQSGTGRL